MVRAVDSLSEMEMSLAGQWDTVNGEVLTCMTVQASMDHDDQLECHTISDVKPVELLKEQLRQSTIKLDRDASAETGTGT